MKRRDFIQLASVTSLATMANAQMRPKITLPFGLEEKTVSELQQMMQAKEMSAKEITIAYIKRIENLDKELNSVIELNPDALDIADKLDAERSSGKKRSELHGIPILLKDNIDTADRMKTTAGSLALIDSPAPQNDAFIVKKLRDAGAIILGKTNLSEWANFRSTSSTSGWSGRGGQTNNPYILERNPCGSSSGSGVAISANLAAIAIGTETDGSIICPSSINGIVGIKPTIGRVSRSGIIPIAHSQDTAGPMTRTVADAAILLKAISGYDRNDTITAAGAKNDIDYARALRKDGLKGKRIGIAKDFWGKKPEVDKIMDEAIAAMKSEGATLIDIKLPTLGKFDDAEFEVLLFEFKTDLEKYLNQRNAKYKTFAELIDFNNRNADKEMPHFKQEIFEMSAKKGGLSDRKYRLALQKCQMLSRTQGIDAAMAKNKLDAILAPANSPSWMTDQVNGDCGYFGSSSFAAVAGYPSITVPAGFIKEMPIGLSLWGKAFSEGKLISMAYAYEQASMARRKPKFLKGA